MAALLALASIASAHAQGRIEISGGYQVTRVPDQTLPLGWSVDIAPTLTDTWSIVAEATGAYRNERNDDLESDVRLSIYTLAAGTRWYSRHLKRSGLFVQLLTGATRVGAKASVMSATLGGSSTRFLQQPGAGLHVKITDVLGVRVQADYQRVTGDKDENAEPLNLVRVVVGMRWGL